MEVRGGARRCTEGCVEVRVGLCGGAQRCMEGCVEVCGDAQRGVQRGVTPIN